MSRILLFLLWLTVFNIYIFNTHLIDIHFNQDNGKDLLRYFDLPVNNISVMFGLLIEKKNGID